MAFRPRSLKADAMYIPTSWITWFICCTPIILIILLMNAANMALQRLYDRIKSMWKENTKKRETEPRNIVMQTGYTYATLIIMAIRSTSEKQILCNIYKWIEDHFPAFFSYRKNWKNPVRHTLSANSCFVKMQRASDDPGRGHYWSICNSIDQDAEPSKKNYIPPEDSVDPVIGNHPHHIFNAESTDTKLKTLSSFYEKYPKNHQSLACSSIVHSIKASPSKRHLNGDIEPAVANTFSNLKSEVFSTTSEIQNRKTLETIEEEDGDVGAAHVSSDLLEVSANRELSFSDDELDALPIIKEGTVFNIPTDQANINAKTQKKYVLEALSMAKGGLTSFNNLSSQATITSKTRQQNKFNSSSGVKGRTPVLNKIRHQKPSTSRKQQIHNALDNSSIAKEEMPAFHKLSDKANITARKQDEVYTSPIEDGLSAYNKVSDQANISAVNRNNDHSRFIRGLESIASSTNDVSYLQEVHNAIYGGTMGHPPHGSPEYFRAAENNAFFGGCFLDLAPPRGANITSSQNSAKGSDGCQLFPQNTKT